MMDWLPSVSGVESLVSSMWARSNTNAPVATGAVDAIARQFAELIGSTAEADAAVSDLAAGKPVELHEVMIQLERARISVQTFVQVRNKLVETYQDLIRMPL